MFADEVVVVGIMCVDYDGIGIVCVDGGVDVVVDVVVGFAVVVFVAVVVFFAGCSVAMVVVGTVGIAWRY